MLEGSKNRCGKSNGHSYCLFSLLFCRAWLFYLFRLDYCHFTVHFIHQNEIGAIYIYLLYFYLCLGVFLLFWKAYRRWFLLLLDWLRLHGNFLPIFPILIQSGRLISQRLGGYTRWETQDLTRALRLARWPKGGSSLSPTSFYSCRDSRTDWPLVFKRAQDSQLEGGPAFGSICVPSLFLWCIYYPDIKGFPL